MFRTKASVSVLAVGGLIAALALGGCNDSDQPEPAGNPSSSELSASPTIDPADGIALRLEGVRISVPDGWERRSNLLRDERSASDQSERKLLVVFDSEAVGDTAPPLSEQVQDEIRQSATLPKNAQRRDDVDLDGEPGWALEGTPNEFQYEYTWGTIARGRDVLIDLTVDSDMPKSARDKLAQSILASFRWNVD